MVEKVKKFLQESREEFRHVNWPTRQEAMHLTSVVICLSIGLAVFLGAFDYSATSLVKTLIAR